MFEPGRFNKIKNYQQRRKRKIIFMRAEIFIFPTEERDKYGNILRPHNCQLLCQQTNGKHKIQVNNLNTLSSIEICKQKIKNPPIFRTLTLHFCLYFQIDPMTISKRFLSYIARLTNICNSSLRYLNYRIIIIF